MASTHRIVSDIGHLLDHSGVPRRVLAKLLATTGVGVGFSLLDVGCGTGELAGYFDALGIRTVGIDESAEQVIAARRNVATCEFHHASIGDPLPSLDTTFDLVLIRDASSYAASLASRSALAATARLLARVRSGGCLAFLQRVDTTAVAHNLSCYARHAAVFPGMHETHWVPDGRAILGGRKASGFGLIVLQTPQESVTEAELQSAIGSSLRSSQAGCCAWAEQMHAEPAPIRRAA